MSEKIIIFNCMALTKRQIKSFKIEDSSILSVKLNCGTVLMQSYICSDRAAKKFEEIEIFTRGGVEL